MFKKVITFLILTITQLDGASELTHAYLAKKWLDLNKKSEEYRGAFMRGTLFPDIRYFASISRESTHDKNVTLHDIASCKDAFDAGKKFHAFVDEFIDKPKNIKKEAKNQLRGTKIITKQAPVLKKYIVMLLKFAEDDIIFAMNDKCADIAKYLGPLDATMRTFNVSDQKLQAWYLLLKSIYFSGTIPSTAIAGDAQKDLVDFLKPIPIHELSQFAPNIKSLAQNHHIQNYTKERLRDFDKTFKKFLKKQKKIS